MTIDELLAAAGLTANDEIPIWDVEATGEPTKKITAQNLAAAVVALANLVTGVKGNAEADYRHGDVNITTENIGAVAKTGDTMTGVLQVKNSAIILTDPSKGNLSLFMHVSSIGESGIYSGGYYDGINLVRDEKWLVYRDTDGVVRLGNTVLVDNGGTGATTAAGALNNFLKQTSRTSIGTWNNSTSVGTSASFDENTVAVYFRLWFSGNAYGGATQEAFRVNSNDDTVILLGEANDGGITRIGVSINWTTNTVILEHALWDSQYWTLSIYKRT